MDSCNQSVDIQGEMRPYDGKTSNCKDEAVDFQEELPADEENAPAPVATNEIANASSGKTLKQRCRYFVADLSCKQLCQRPNALTARYYYGFMFLVTNVFAWLVRDYGHKFLSELDHLKGCRGGHDCLGSEGVLRVSMGCFLFFATMLLTTMGTTKSDDPRNSWHSEWWPLKGTIWLTLMTVPFVIPSAFIQFYGEIARFGAGIFLIIQLVSVINFVTWWNKFWSSDKKAAQSRPLVIAMSSTAYATTLTVIILVYLWYAPYSSCHLNIFFITWTLILLLAITCVSFHPKVNAGAMTSGLMSLYTIYLCWSALRSEPETEKCNTRPQATGRGDWMTILGFLIAMLAVVMTTFSTGIDSKSFRFKKADSEEEIPYGYGFFHFVFSMGAMYFGMLFIGWNLPQTMQRWSIDVGWISTWVKIVNEWLAAGLYVWTLIAPLVWKKRSKDKQAPNHDYQTLIFQMKNIVLFMGGGVILVWYAL